MVDVAYSSLWFFAGDLLIDGLSALVLLAIAMFAFRSLRLRRASDFTPAYAFLLLGLAYVCKFVATYLLHADRFTPDIIEGTILVHIGSLLSSDAAFYVLFLLFRFSLVFGLYLVYASYGSPPRFVSWLFAGLAAGVVLVTVKIYLVVQILTFALSVLAAFACYRRYVSEKRASMLLTVFSFGLFALSRLIVLFAAVSPVYAVAGAIVRLIAFSLLLTTFGLVFYYARAK